MTILRIYWQKNIDSECVSPKGNYTVDGFNMLLYTSVYPKGIY